MVGGSTVVEGLVHRHFLKRMGAFLVTLEVIVYGVGKYGSFGEEGKDSRFRYG